MVEFTPAKVNTIKRKERNRKRILFKAWQREKAREWYNLKKFFWELKSVEIRIHHPPFSQTMIIKTIFHDNGLEIKSHKTGVSKCIAQCTASHWQESGNATFAVRTRPRPKEDKGALAYPGNERDARIHKQQCNFKSSSSHFTWKKRGTWVKSIRNRNII